MTSTNDKAVITLSAPAAKGARRLATKMDTTLAKTIRRGLLLLDLYLNLPENEELVIRNRNTKEIDRIAFLWEGGLDG